MKYELIYIIAAAVEEEARKALITRFNELIQSNGGQVEKVDEWGKRHLAYTIDYKTEGYYVMVTFDADSTLPRELERNLENSENVIRYLVTRVEEKRSNVKPRAQQPVRSFAPQRPVEEPVQRQEAPAPAVPAQEVPLQVVPAQDESAPQ